MPKPIIFAPYLGEFGHAILTWAGYVAMRCRDMPHRTRFVCAPEGTQELYRDALATGAKWVGFQWPPDAPPSNWLSLEKKADQWHAMILRRCFGDEIDADLVFPEPGREAFDALWNMAGVDPVRVRTQSPSVPGCVGIMARDRAFAPQRNAPDDWWASAVARLSDSGLGVVSLGTVGGNRFISGTLDRRQVSGAGAVAAMIAQCSVVVGESSGGMHLAAAVGRPCVVFGEPHAEGRYRRQEALSGMPVAWVDGLAPDPRRVVSEVVGLAGVRA